MSDAPRMQYEVDTRFAYAIACIVVGIGLFAFALFFLGYDVGFMAKCNSSGGGCPVDPLVILEKILAGIALLSIAGGIIWDLQLHRHNLRAIQQEKQVVN